jgi:putative transposase
LSASRYCYNKAIAIMRDKWIAKEKLPTAYNLRSLVMDNIPEWVNQCPYNLRGNAVIDAYRAFKKTKLGNKYTPKFRSCRQPVQSCKMQSSNWKQSMTYPTHKTDSGIKLSELKINPSEELPIEMPSDFSLVLDRGRWFIIFAIPVINNKAIDSQQGVFLDCGVRTFQTCFDGNKVIEIGNKSISLIVTLCKRLDGIMSEIAKATGRVNKRKRFNLRKLAQQLRIRIKNLIDECHKKTACFLTDNYSDVFIPKFESKDMVCKATRKINSKSARQMLTWSHYRFKQLLKFKCEIKGVNYHEVTEEYTSKTCSKCGHIHPKLGGNKTFKCSNCGHKIDRDWNGAIGICLKTLSDLRKVG